MSTFATSPLITNTSVSEVSSSDANSSAREIIVAEPAKRHVHLLYVPTIFCNINCSYCYLGELTNSKDLKKDINRAVGTLRFALAKCAEENILPFNVSLHGGEVTTMPAPILEELFQIIQKHYMGNFDALHALGYRKANPHIKTNLYKFAPLIKLFSQYKVSISASIDLPLELHGRYRTLKNGRSWLGRTKDNLKLLAQYPHNKKISATISAIHLEDMQAIVDDIWYIHRDIGLDMNNMNLMFAFESKFNQEDDKKMSLEPVTPEQQLELYHILHKEFAGTELEEGLKRHWFDEFSPSYCTNAFNCGEKFYLLQSDGNVYSCVRGQGIPEFHYGNIFDDSMAHIFANGAHKISLMHQEYGFDSHCQSCNHLSRCHTGCPVVKYQRNNGRSYTCDLQHQMYADNPLSYPPDDSERQALYKERYQVAMHPDSAESTRKTVINKFILPNDMVEDKNTLLSIIAEDEKLELLYREAGFILQWADESLPLYSQIIKAERDIITLTAEDSIGVHVHKDLLATGDDALRNTLYLQMLRDTPVVYGDEQRSKQAHLFNYQLWLDFLQPSRHGDDYLYADLSAIIHAHAALYHENTLNNLFFTTNALRDYHYHKQKHNAFYHIQAINLPFHNIEFYYLADEVPNEEVVS